MSSTHPSPPPSGRLARSWSLVWRLGSSLLVGLVAFSLVYGWTIEQLGTDADDSTRLAVLMVLDVLAAPVAIGLLALRRRPLAAAVVVVLSGFSVLSIGAGILAAVSFAAAQPVRRIVALGIAFTAVTTAAGLLLPDPELGVWVDALGAAAAYAVLALVGLYVRSRRELVASLRAEATSARRAQDALADSARSAERARIAREMHDALGHRLSVIAMHAGALESRPDLSAADTRLAAGVVRESAHGAMAELRDVLGVLNEESSMRSEGTDLPTLAQLDELVAAGVGGGVVPSVRREVDVTAMPETVSRHLYRIAQEALTNVRKHAPGRPTEVVLRTPAEGEVELVVRNETAGALTGPVLTGQALTGQALTGQADDRTRHGLTGLAERARLAGGSVTAGVEGSHFAVRAVLPCRR